MLPATGKQPSYKNIVVLEIVFVKSQFKDVVTSIKESNAVKLTGYLSFLVVAYMLCHIITQLKPNELIALA